MRSIRSTDVSFPSIPPHDQPGAPIVREIPAHVSCLPFIGSSREGRQTEAYDRNTQLWSRGASKDESVVVTVDHRMKSEVPDKGLLQPPSLDHPGMSVTRLSPQASMRYEVKPAASGVHV